MSIISLLGFLIEPAPPSVELALDGCIFLELNVPCWNCGGLRSCGEGEGCHLICSRISILSCKGLFEEMFNYYQYRASPDHEASDIGYEEFGHLVFSFLVGG